MVASTLARVTLFAAASSMDATAAAAIGLPAAVEAAAKGGLLSSPELLSKDVVFVAPFGTTEGKEAVVSLLAGKGGDKRGGKGGGMEWSAFSEEEAGRWVRTAEAPWGGTMKEHVVLNADGCVCEMRKERL